MNRVAQASEPAGLGGILPPVASAGRDARRTRSQDGCATRFMDPTHVRILEVSAVHEHHFKKREQAPRTPNASRCLGGPGNFAKRLECVRLAGALVQGFKAQTFSGN